MLNKSLYIDTQDQLWHLRYIKLLAEELNRPVQEITPVYEDVLMQLKDQANIQIYLAIFASKRVKLVFNNLSPTRSGGEHRPNSPSANVQIASGKQMYPQGKALRGRASA